MKKPKYADVNPFERLHPQEPYFFIRGQDKLSVTAVMGYAELLQAEADKADKRGDVRIWESLSDQASEVARFAQTFLDWQAANPDKVKLPD